MAADMAPTPVTEESNVVTENIDIASALEIPELLCKCDQEIFDGWQSYPNISSPNITAVIQCVIRLAADVFRHPHDNGIVLSGCGTSGRLAFFIARSFNAALNRLNKTSCCEYLISGGDMALFTSQEAPEDCPLVGQEALVQVCSQHQWKKVLFIGITCGLSAPYVAGQLDYCMQHPDYFTPVLLGFNPVDMARDNPIEGWDKTFRQIARQMQHLQTEGKGFVLNPIVGPEAITGSSRMKGGSGTKILLELILWTSLLQAGQQSPTEGALSITALLKMYQRVLDVVRQHSKVSAECITLAGNSLNVGGHLYYIAADSLGILAIIDASECPPTFGATLEDIRGVIPGGFKMLRNREGDLSSLGDAFKISTRHFVDNVLPLLRACDTVIFLLCETNKEMNSLASSIMQQCPDTAVVGLQFLSPNSKQHQDSCKNDFHYFADIQLPWDDLLQDLQPTGITSWSEPHALQAAHFAMEMTAKWTLNSISTGAHILKGKAFIKLWCPPRLHAKFSALLSNSKLFHRGVGIVERFAQCSREDARLAILKALYNTNEVTAEMEMAPVSKYNLLASQKDKVIPTALLLGINGCSIEDTASILLSAPVIRDAIAKMCDQKL